MSMLNERQTGDQMWQAFITQATRNNPTHKVPIELRVGFYAGAHGMLAEVLAMLRSDEERSSEWRAVFNRWSDELTKFSDDYRDGKI